MDRLPDVTVPYESEDEEKQEVSLPEPESETETDNSIFVKPTKKTISKPQQEFKVEIVKQPEPTQSKTASAVAEPKPEIEPEHEWDDTYNMRQIFERKEGSRLTNKQVKDHVKSMGMILKYSDIRAALAEAFPEQVEIHRTSTTRGFLGIDMLSEPKKPLRGLLPCEMINIKMAVTQKSNCNEVGILVSTRKKKQPKAEKKTKEVDEESIKKKHFEEFKKQQEEEKKREQERLKQEREAEIKAKQQEEEREKRYFEKFQRIQEEKKMSRKQATSTLTKMDSDFGLYSSYF